MENLSALTTFEAWAVYYGISIITVVIGSFIAIRSITRDVYLHHRVAIITTGIIVCLTNAILGSFIASNLTKVPEIESITPKENSIVNPDYPEIAIVFKTPIRYTTLRAYSYPENELTIIPDGYADNHLDFGRSVRIMPTHNFPPGEQIIIYLANIEGPLTHGFGGENSIRFTSIQLPTVNKVLTPTNTKSVPVKPILTYQLTGKASRFSTWEAVSDPPVPLTITVQDDTVSLTPEHNLNQGTSYAIHLFQTPLVVNLSDGKKYSTLTTQKENTTTITTVKPPFIQSVSPQGTSTNPNDPIVIHFDEPMDRNSVESKLLIQPIEETKLIWDMTKTSLQINHADFPKNTRYSVTLKSGIRTIAGGQSSGEFTHAFTTAGNLQVISSEPANLNLNASQSATIVAMFNQPFKSETLKDKIVITPATKGTYDFSENQFIFIPDKPFLPNTRYVMTISPGVESIYGLPTKEPQTITFTTRPNETILPVPFFKQESNFTCNIASTRMLLAYRGINVSESELITKIGNGGKRDSGNPYKGYVDDYGTYWNAILPVANSFRPSRLISDGTVQKIVSEIKKGNPVMTWGQNGWSDPHDISWTATDGTYIKAINGMHSAIIRGFSGPETNPTTIMLNDPWRGQYSIPTGEFLRRWSYFNIGMVIE